MSILAITGTKRCSKRWKAPLRRPMRASRGRRSTTTFRWCAEARLAQLQSPTWLTFSVRRRLPMALFAIIGLEMKLHIMDAQSRDPRKIHYFASPTSGTYSHFPLVPDLRQLGRMTFMRSSTVKVHDTYMGTDKFAHFMAMGYWYYTYYSGSPMRR